MKKSKLDKLNFLLGSWTLSYDIPESQFSQAGKDSGTGSFKKILNDQYLLFEYSTESGGEAKGIFAWDEKINMFRYWWFENSGSFQSATCNLINEKTLALNWHDTLFVQTFEKVNSDSVILKMEYPAEKGGYDLVLEVSLTRH